MDARSFLGNCDTVLIRVYCRFHVLLWIMFCSIFLFFSELVLKLMLCVLIGINLNIVGSLVHLFILIFHLYSCKLILNGSGKNCESFFFPSLILVTGACVLIMKIILSLLLFVSLLLVPFDILFLIPENT